MRLGLFSMPCLLRGYLATHLSEFIGYSSSQPLMGFYTKRK
jgi:hypothetical protein